MTLVANKLATGRTKDLADLEALGEADQRTPKGYSALSPAAARGKPPLIPRDSALPVDLDPRQDIDVLAVDEARALPLPAPAPTNRGVRCVGLDDRGGPHLRPNARPTM